MTAPQHDNGHGQHRALRARSGWLGLFATVVALALLGLAFGAGWLVPDEPALELTDGGTVAVLPILDRGGLRTDAWVEWGLPALISDLLARHPGIEVVDSHRLHQALADRQLDEQPTARDRARQLAAGLGANVIVDASFSRGRRGNSGVILAVDVYGADDQQVASEDYQAASALEAADLASSALARGLITGIDPLPLDRAFSGDPFVDQLYAAGIDRLWTEDADAARPYFSIALEHQPDFLRAKAKELELMIGAGNVELAREASATLLQEAQSRNDGAMSAAGYAALGHLEARAGNYAAAQAQFDLAANAHLSRGDRRSHADMVAEMARLARVQGDDEKSSELLNERLKTQQATNDRLGQADSLLRLGSQAMAGSDLEGAEALLAEASTVADQLGDSWLKNRIAASHGEVAWRRGDVAEARQRWQEALEFARQQNDTSRQMVLLNSMARASMATEEWRDAEGHYQDVLQLAIDQEDKRTESTATVRLAWLQLRLGYPLQAKPLLARSLELDSHLPDRSELQRVIAWAAYEQGSYDLAASTLESIQRRRAASWSDSDEAFLAVYQSAAKRGERLPLPGELGYRANSS